MESGQCLTVRCITAGLLKPAGTSLMQDGAAPLQASVIRGIANQNMAEPEAALSSILRRSRFEKLFIDQARQGLLSCLLDIFSAQAGDRSPVKEVAIDRC